MKEEILISFTIEEFADLKEGYEEFLAETSPKPNSSMRSLAKKLELNQSTHSWIDRLINK